MQDFNSALEKFLAHASSLQEHGEKIYAMKGRRYVRIVREYCPGQRSAFCFVDKQTGDVLKCAGWKAPAKHARGNIYSGEYGIGQFGAAYLR